MPPCPLCANAAATARRVASRRIAIPPVRGCLNSGKTWSHAMQLSGGPMRQQFLLHGAATRWHAQHPPQWPKLFLRGQKVLGRAGGAG